MLTVTWYPPGLDPITFNDDPYALVNIDNISNSLAKIKTRQGPQQIGASLTGANIDPRVITLTVELVAAEASEMWDLRITLAGKLAYLPGNSTGVLVFSREGQSDVVIEAYPQDSPDIIMKNEFYAVATLKFICLDPLFKDPIDSSTVLSVLGGFQFGTGYDFQFPLTISSFNVQKDIFNGGTVAVPVLIRIYGACDTPRVKNLTTGETLEISGVIAAGDYVEINTAYGAKSVTLVSGTTRTNIMNRVSLSNADFWQLKVGTNTVKFDPVSSTSGQVAIIWRQKFSGI